MIELTTPEEVRAALLLRQELALIDLREEDDYAQAHPLFAASLPLSRLELEVLDRIPRKTTHIVVYDDEDDLAPIALQRLKALGYNRVSVLEGGLKGWADAGYELFRDVNSASKAFGELVEARRHTPSLPAPEAQALLEADPDVVVLDARRFEEYRTMSIPGGVSVPGAELVLRARELAPDPRTKIIVNCAGRTRSIIGAQSLINAGVPNPVVALRNGTIGWTLAGQKLETGQSRRFPEVSADTLEQARAKARAVSYRAGVRRIDVATLSRLAADSARTLYRFDVRTPEEFAAGHIRGFRNAPGGQLVQETDVFAPVRGARIVLADDKGPRADMTASWLAQMGWEALVLDGGFDGVVQIAPEPPNRPEPPPVQQISPHALAAQPDAVVIDLGPSPAHRTGHVPGAWFAIRSQLKDALARLPKGPLVLTSPDGLLARFAAPEVQALTGAAPRVLRGGTAGWAASGLPLEKGLKRVANAPVDVYRRPYEGTDNAVEAMQAYLDWEFGLVAQLERDASHGFFVV